MLCPARVTLRWASCISPLGRVEVYTGAHGCAWVLVYVGAHVCVVFAQV